MGHIKTGIEKRKLIFMLEMSICVGEMSSDKMSVDQMSVDKMSVDKMSVDKMSVDKCL